MTEASPSVQVDLVWAGDLRFEASTSGTSLVIDSDGQAGPSPVRVLAIALAGCMAMDVVHILAKGRQEVSGLRVRLDGWRAESDPRRLTRVDLHFVLEGDVPQDKVERALALSREKYCSVWHSLRQDIDLTVAYELRDTSV